MVVSKNKKTPQFYLNLIRYVIKFHAMTKLDISSLLISVFHNKNPKSLLFIEIYQPVFEKNKKMESFERSTLQLMSILVRDEGKDMINSFAYSSKTHSTLGKKKLIPFYTEHLYFLIKRARWLVTYIYEHYTFKQSKSKEDFVVMNQKSRRKAATSVERDFSKLLNNSNIFPALKNSRLFLAMIRSDIFFTRAYEREDYSNFSRKNICPG